MIALVQVHIDNNFSAFYFYVLFCLTITQSIFLFFRLNSLFTFILRDWIIIERWERIRFGGGKFIIEFVQVLSFKISSLSKFLIWHLHVMSEILCVKVFQVVALKKPKALRISIVAVMVTMAQQRCKGSDIHWNRVAITLR